MIRPCYIFRFTSLILIFLTAFACNKRDLDDLNEIAKDHEARLARMEKMLIEASQHIKLINKLLVEYDGRLTVTSTEETDKGFYIHFSDGDTVFLNSGKTPAVTLSVQNTWVINGVDTRISCEGIGADGDVIAPRIRIAGGKWEISVDEGKTWRTTGIEVQGKDGEDGGGGAHIGIGGNGHWYVNGRDLGIPAFGEDGKDAPAPLLDIRENPDGSSNWWVKNGDEEWKDTGILAVGKDGSISEDGGRAPYVTSVTVSGRKVSFIFSDNIPGKTPATNIITVDRTVTTSYTIFEDGAWVTLPSKPFAIPIGGIRTISFRFRTALPGNNYGWKVILPDGFDFLGLTTDDMQTFNVRVFVNRSVTEYRSGLIFLTVRAVGQDNNTIIPVSTQLYKIDVSGLAFTDSYVYNVYNDANEKVAEVCREYIDDGRTGTSATVIYPYNNATLEYGRGYVTGLGGTVDHTTGRYDPLGGYDAGRNDIYFLSSRLFMLNVENYMYVTPLAAGRFISDKAVDAQGNNYKVVKIGPQYWMAENLKAETYSGGEPLRIITDQADWNATPEGACCYYQNDKTANAEKYGLLYNGNAVSTGRIAPTGWRVPDVEDWKMLELFLGMPQDILDNQGWRGTTEGNKLKNTVGWQGSGSGNNLTMFNALPGGYREMSGFSGLGQESGWWAVNGADGALHSWGLSAGRQDIKNTVVNKQNGYTVRCIRNNR